ncbi:Uu.00g122750.m01.CDS01 [Anthostomella pinea]|uniref:Uu.00g122750.m01.CDS01 n=1 Tax=Anthostomella pinea TaxID=933095 RepID=A0AAI8VHT5_9PEZI|nr:Uu.00g122750.m01.CDS01 [Anthostomella pinea]
MEALDMDKCNTCGGKKGKNGAELKKCSRCSKTKYCSVECQKEDWSKHRKTCGKN